MQSFLDKIKKDIGKNSESTEALKHYEQLKTFYDHFVQQEHVKEQTIREHNFVMSQQRIREALFRNSFDKS
jgi:hypothetical protein